MIQAANYGPIVPQYHYPQPRSNSALRECIAIIAERTHKPPEPDTSPSLEHAPMLWEYPLPGNFLLKASKVRQGPGSTTFRTRSAEMLSSF